MTKDPASRFKSAVTEALQPLRPSLIEVLRQLVEYDYPKAVASIAFEVFADGFTQGFPVRAFFVDEANTEFFVPVEGEYEYPSPVNPGLLTLERVYEDSLEEMFLAEDDTLDVFTLAAEALIPWFAECWKRAGGAHFGRSATIMIHDDTRLFDLVGDGWLEPNGAP